MKFLNLLIKPAFLQKIDQYLLLHYPAFWSVRLHYAIYHWFITSLLVFLLSCCFPTSLTEIEEKWPWSFCFIVLSIVMGINYIVRCCFFNHEKEFGKRHWTQEYLRLFAFFLALSLFSSFTFIFDTVSRYKIAHLISDEELAKDIQGLNQGSAFMIDYFTDYQLVRQSNEDPYYDKSAFSGYTKFTPFMVADSIYPTALGKLLEDSSRVFKYYTLKKNVLNSSREQRIAWTQRHIQIRLKYEFFYPLLAAEYVKLYDNMQNVRYEYFESLPPKGNNYALKHDKNVDEIIQSIAHAKNPMTSYWMDTSLRGVLFFLLCGISLLFLAFKNVEWKHLLIAALSALGILLILIFLSSFFHVYRNGKSYFSINAVVFTYILALLIPLTSFARSRFSIWLPVALILAFYATPFMLTSIITSYEIKVMGHWVTYEYDTSSNYYEYDHWLLYTMNIGIFLVLLPLFKSLFMRLYALPRNK
jgi:hypothetical protein